MDPEQEEWNCGSAACYPLQVMENKQSFHFQDANVTILQTAKDLLGATIRCGGHQLLVIVCHAPHDGSHEDVKEEWWSRLSAFVDQHRRKGRLIILGDFNARLGNSIEPYIGDRLCSITTDNGERFQDFVGRHGIWLPSTSSNYRTTSDHKVHVWITLVWISLQRGQWFGVVRMTISRYRIQQWTTLW